MSLNSLQSEMKIAMNQRIETESRAKRGFIQNGKFISGNEQYKAVQAVECNIDGKVYAVITSNKKAVIVGA